MPVWPGARVNPGGCVVGAAGLGAVFGPSAREEEAAGPRPVWDIDISVQGKRKPSET